MHQNYFANNQLIHFI